MRLFKIRRKLNLSTHPSASLAWEFLDINNKWINIKTYKQVHKSEPILFKTTEGIGDKMIDNYKEEDVDKEWHYELQYHSGSDLDDKKMPDGKEDYYYTEEDIAMLSVRAYNDRLSRVAYNLWKIQRGDYFKELYAELVVNLKTEIIDKLKAGTLQSGKHTIDDDEDLKKMKEFTNTFLMIIKNLPGITKGFKTLEKHIGIVDKEAMDNKITPNRTAEQMIKDKLKHGVSK